MRSATRAGGAVSSTALTSTALRSTALTSTALTTALAGGLVAVLAACTPGAGPTSAAVGGGGGAGPGAGASAVASPSASPVAPVPRPSATPTAPAAATAGAVATPRPPAGTAVVAPDDAVAAAVATSAALFATAPVVVLAPVEDLRAQVRAARAAVALGVPLLLTAGAAAGPVVAAEVDRLGARVVLHVGAAPAVPDAPDAPDAPDVRDVVAPADDAALADLLGRALPAVADGVAGDGSPAAVLAVTDAVAAASPAGTAPAPSPAPVPGAGAGPARDAAEALLRRTRPGPPAGTGLVVVDGGTPSPAAAASARAAGLPVAVVAGADVAAADAVVRVAASAGAPLAPDAPVLAVGAFADPGTLAWQVRAASTGVQLPGGGQRVLPGRHLVALYGTPGAPALGLLGEQGLEATLQRAREVAAPYDALTDAPVVPTLEIIATVASAGPGDGDYSSELDPAVLAPWVDAAGAAGAYVLLDLQPGRDDFLTQARAYEDLLRRPWVGLALDPEWRLAPDELPLQQIGSVGVDEVEAVRAWLVDLVRREALPQKLLVLHQFRASMVQGRERLTTTRPEVAVLVHVDGQGNQPAKAGTWAALRRDAPPGLLWGWKNFLDEDTPVLTPEQTWAVQPTPDLVTYQ
ncbi:hypothetical protein [Cellulomonas marina]|uniref:Uncharacterized protein n=1 Tax=Cellulomonas marina TaxID=988821 RepID=A0A1I1AGQ7_9CELL|nr:hypothetical protein [Cellulomonas marina]GIG29739.1 hypothetical protein Cma02nite_23390 [Cellulomonas marina]SFB35680.1 hypothetical protein SAMN05421867_11715 [Cellulomonas marina]